MTKQVLWILALVALVVIAGQQVECQTIGISQSGHFITYSGQTLHLIGDNATQCMLQNKNMNYRQWIDDCYSRGIRSIHLWGFIGPRQKQDGSQIEARYGYVYPGVTPWTRYTSGSLGTDQLYRWNLRAFDESTGGYWDRLRDLCDYAKDRGIIVGITPFFGWPKNAYGWEYHPFNSANGGHLTQWDTVQTIASPGTEVWSQTWSDSWTNAKKTQWIWENYCKKLIDDCGSYGNVYFTFMDEHSYTEGNCGDHFRDFFRSRGVKWMDWNNRRSTVDFVYSNTFDTVDKNSVAVSGFTNGTVRPYFLLEGPPYMGDDFRTSFWTFQIGGGMYHYQSDSGQETEQTGIMGYDPNVQNSNRTAYLVRLSYLGYCSALFNQYVTNLDSLYPNNALGSTGTYTLAALGSEYVVYSKIGASTNFNVNLTHASGTLTCRFYSPRTGAFQTPFYRTGGSTQSFTKPDSNDWILHIIAQVDTQAPSVPTNVAAAAQSSSSINVTWTASTDNVGVAGYKVFRNGAQVGTSATTSYPDSGLSPSTTYSYKVSAYDAAQNESSQSSPAATATTDAISAGFCSIDLGSSDVNNLLSHPQNGDGDTTAATVGGLECRQPVNTGDQYFYFAVNDSFIYNTDVNTYLEVCYYDDQSSSVYMQPQFDSTSGAYTSAGSLYFGNTGKWKTATWTLNNCKFANSQNVGADFRIYVGAYSVKIDSVRISTVQFSDYTSSERDLGANEIYQGLSHPATWTDSDGDTTVVDYGGRSCRRALASGDNYFYFNVSDALIYNGSNSTIYLKVEYYDSSGGQIQPQYDSNSNPYTSATALNFTGTSNWKEAYWTLTDCKFANSQNGSADFRLYVGTAQNVYIDKVVVSEVAFGGDSQAPSVPTNVSATAQSETSINVTWTASTDNVGVTGYKVFRNGGQVGTSGTTSYLDTGLSPSTTYSYTVLAYDAAQNESAQSSPPAAATTPDNTAPSVPTNVSATAQSESSINVTWTASTDNVGVTGYKVFRNGGQVGTSGTTSYLDTGLSPSTTYSYTVSAYDAANNNSAQSSPPAVETTQGGGSTVTLMEDNFDNSSIDNRWTVKSNSCSAAATGTVLHSTSADACGGADGFAYRTYSGDRCMVWKTSFSSSGYTSPKLTFWYKNDSGASIQAYVLSDGNWTSLGTVSTASSWTKAEYNLSGTITGVRFDLKAASNVTRRLDCVSITATQAGDTQAPSVPTNVAATAQSETSVQVSWTASTDNVGVTGYKVFRNGGQVGTSTTTSYSDTGLSPSTTYSYTVSAYDAAQNESAQSSPPAVATTPDNTAPSVPTNVAAAAQSSTSINVTWTASTDNVGVTGYKVFRNGGQVGTSGTTSYLDTGLSPSTTYSYTVSAYDAANNNSAQSSPPAVETTQGGTVTLMEDNFDNSSIDNRWTVKSSSCSAAATGTILHSTSADACGGADGFAYRTYSGDRCMVWKTAFSSSGYSSPKLTFWYKNDSGASIQAYVKKDGVWTSMGTVGTASSWTKKEYNLTGTITGVRFDLKATSNVTRRLDCVSITATQ